MVSILCNPSSSPSLSSSSSSVVEETLQMDEYDNGSLSLTEVCQLLEVSWQMCHAWIAHWTVARATLTMSRPRSTHDGRTQGRKRARTFFWGAREPVWRLERPYSSRGARDECANKEPSMASELHIKSSIPNTYQ